MPIIDLYGHDALRARLLDALDRGALPSSLLLWGSRGVGKQRLALFLGQALLCESDSRPCGDCQHCRYSISLTHPDLRWYFPRPRLKDSDPDSSDIHADLADEISSRVASSGLYAVPSGSDAIFVATTRALVREASLGPAMARRRVFVVGDAERMVAQEGADQAANAFLKLLEEPPAGATIILTSSEPGSLLPTIRSRVVAIRVPRLPGEDVERFLADPRVQKQLSAESLPDSVTDRVRLAAGAPGTLIGRADQRDATAAARRLLDAATAPRPERMRTAFAQGGAKARGAFSATLDALTVLLHEHAREALERRDEGTASAASRAIPAVERAKTLAGGNVNPQLLGARLVRELADAFR